MRNLKEKASCPLQVQRLPAAAGKRQGSDARRRSDWWWYCSLVLVRVAVVCGYTRAHTTLFREEEYTSKDVAGYAGRDFLPSHRDGAGSNQHTWYATSQIIQPGYAAPPALCAGPPAAASIAPQRPSCTSSLALSRERHSSRRHTSHVPTATRSHRLPHQSLQL